MPDGVGPPDPVKKTTKAPSGTAAETLSSGQLCAATGLKRGTLRLYEREGLIAPLRRSAAGYRAFSPAVIEQVMAIRAAKSTGMSLAQIREILGVIEEKNFSAQRARAVLGRQLEALDLKLDQLQHLKEILTRVYRQPYLLVDPNCNLLQDLAGDPTVVRNSRKSRS